jgi:Tat protein secretion system quality control protein TatD with DNase activity
LNDERVYGSCGIHPHWSSAWRESFIKDIERCLKHPKIVAIGEIGLDFGPK